MRGAIVDIVSYKFCTLLCHAAIYSKSTDYHSIVSGMLEEVALGRHFDPTLYPWQCSWAELGVSLTALDGNPDMVCIRMLLA